MFGRHDRKVDAASLRDVVLFSGFTDHELERVAELGRPVDAEQGTVLVEQGRVGLECYVVVEGQANVYAGDDFLATVGPGAPVGEMALMEHLPRSATVVAATPMHLIVFDVKHFRSLLDEMPSARQRLEALMQERSTLLRDRRLAPTSQEDS
jgi:CRP-like cAMP-binding protein